jgi:hypothetical protein
MFQGAAISTPDVGDSSTPGSHGTVTVVGIWRSSAAIAEVTATETTVRVSNHLHGPGGGDLLDVITSLCLFYPPLTAGTAFPGR